MAFLDIERIINQKNVDSRFQKKQKKKNLLKIINHNFIFIPCHTL